MRRRMGAAIVVVAILVAAVVMVETTSRDDAPETARIRVDAESYVERRVARYLSNSRRRLLGRLGPITAVRCADLPTYGYGSAGCDIVFEKAGRQRWWVMYTTDTDFVAEPCPTHLLTGPWAGPDGSCDVVVPA